MKKILILILTIIAYCTFSLNVFAYGSPVLSTNHSFSRSTTLFGGSPSISNYNLTDNSNTSIAAMYASGVNYWFWNTTAFSPLKRIDGFKLVPASTNATDAASATFTLSFYNASNSLITSRTSISAVNTTNIDIPPVSGVSRIAFTCTGDVDCRIAEIQLYELPPDTQPPTTPTNFLVNPQDGKLALSWNPSTDNETVSHYEVYKDGNFLANTTNLNFDVIGPNGDNIEVKIRAVDESGNKSSFTTAQVTYPRDNVPPYQPIGLAIVVTDYQASLTWDEHTATDFKQYKLYKDLNFITAINNRLTNTYVFTSLNNNQTYSFGVQAVDTSLNASTISTISAKINGTPPPVPTGLTVTPGNGSLELNWDDVTASDLEGYNVYANGTKMNTTPIIGSFKTLNSLTNNLSYTIRISSVDSDENESLLSAPVTSVPKAPLNVDVIPNGTNARIIVTGGSAPFTYTINGTTAVSNDPDFIIGGLTPSTDYTITVTDDEGAVFTSTFDSYIYSGILSPPVPDLTDTINSALGTFTDGGTIGITIAIAAVSLLIIILLAFWAWRLTKKKLRSS
jgi:hypothetical protein